MARVRLWRQHVCSCTSPVHLSPAVLSLCHCAWDENKNSCYWHGVFKGTVPFTCIITHAWLACNSRILLASNTHTARYHTQMRLSENCARSMKWSVHKPIQLELIAVSVAVKNSHATNSTYPKLSELLTFLS